jgi:hypothetical protein
MSGIFSELPSESLVATCNSIPNASGFTDSALSTHATESRLDSVEIAAIDGSYSRKRNGFFEGNDQAEMLATFPINSRTLA